METCINQHIDNLKSKDKKFRYESFHDIIKITNERAEWAYEVWDDLINLLEGDNHQRAIAAQVLSNLAKSDSEQRLLYDFKNLLNATKDEKFVTARYSLQCLWKIGIVNEAFRDIIVDGLSGRFNGCINEKNCTLIRYDIMVVFRKMFDQMGDEKIKSSALALIETEDDEKYRNKYLGVWKDVLEQTKKPT